MPRLLCRVLIPKPAQRPKKKAVETARADVADVRFKSSEDTSAQQRDQKQNKNQADEYLRRAEQDIEKDKKEQKFDSYDFDTYGAFEKAFGFFSDPAVWIVAAVPGFFLGCALQPCDWSETGLLNKTRSLDSSAEF